MTRRTTVSLLLACCVAATAAAGCHKAVRKDRSYQKVTTSEPAASPNKRDHKPDAAPTPQDNAPQDYVIEATGAVAIVDGKAISAKQFDERAARRLRLLGKPKLTVAQARMLAKRVLDRLIDEALIDQQLAQANIAVDPKRVDDEYAKFVARLHSQKKVQRYLTKYGMDEAEMKHNLGKDQMLRQLLAKKYGVSVSDADMRDYYDKHIDEYKHRAEVRARHILVKVGEDASNADVQKAEQRARKLAQVAKKPGADFAALARENSDGPSASRGGDLGFFDRKRMVEPFANAAFRLKPGQVSEPVRTRFGFHIIKVVARRPAATTPYADVKVAIRKRLLRLRFRKALGTLLNDLRSNAHIERHAERISIQPRT